MGRCSFCRFTSLPITPQRRRYRRTIAALSRIHAQGAERRRRFRPSCLTSQHDIWHGAELRRPPYTRGLPQCARNRVGTALDPSSRRRCYHSLLRKILACYPAAPALGRHAAPPARALAPSLCGPVASRSLVVLRAHCLPAPRLSLRSQLPGPRGSDPRRAARRDLRPTIRVRRFQ